MKQQKMLNVQIGERLRKCRKAKNHTQAVMAEKLGISVNAYGLLERGQNSLSPEKFHLLRTEFGIDLNYLITGDNPLPSIFLDALSECPKEKQFDMQNLIRYAVNLSKELDIRSSNIGGEHS